jgi:tRNA pseudouridine55 synthase
VATATDPPRRERRRVDGVLLLDKPIGCTSNAALQRAKRAYGAAKAGHAGTLDPAASGLLPICLGEATKFAQGLTDADKTYEALVELGVTTTTGDAEGEVTGRHEVAVSPEAVEAALAGFRDPILQVPPMHSALKRQGQPLYAYARRGEEVARAPRPVTIHELRLLQASGTRLRLLVRCSKGTYVRVLAEDIGRALGCGAHLAGLRRTAVGVFAVAQAHPLDEFEALNHEQRAALLLPADALLEGLPSLQLDAAGAAAFRHGRAVPAPSGGAAGLLRAYGPAGEFLGVGGHDPGRGEVLPSRVVAAAPGGAVAASATAA